MFNKTFQLLIAKNLWWKLSVTLTLLLGILNPDPLLATVQKTKVHLQKVHSIYNGADLIAQKAVNKNLLADGVYLYGQTVKPAQIGSEYLVFQVVGRKVVGAFYLPNSEFNCFSGNIEATAIKVSVVDPYDNTVHPYSIALETSTPVATTTPQTPSNFALAGYQEIEQISIGDRQLLNACRQQTNL